MGDAVAKGARGGAERGCVPKLRFHARLEGRGTQPLAVHDDDRDVGKRSRSAGDLQRCSAVAAGRGEQGPGVQQRDALLPPLLSPLLQATTGCPRRPRSCRASDSSATSTRRRRRCLKRPRTTTSSARRALAAPRRSRCARRFRPSSAQTAPHRSLLRINLPCHHHHHRHHHTQISKQLHT